MKFKTYFELIELPTFAERFEYLKLNGTVGDDTFGYGRYLNQTLYRSVEWKRFRRQIIMRDNGCDLAFSDRPICERVVIIHHLNPITKEQILNRDPIIFDPQNVVCCCHNTHMAIHYGSLEKADFQLIERRANDTAPWRH